MPPAYEDVLGYCEDTDIIIQAAWLSRWYRWEFGNGNTSAYCGPVTYWMPLPKKPNSKLEDEKDIKD